MVLLSVLAVSLGALVAPVRSGVKYPDCENGPLRLNLVCDTSASPEARASALVAAMNNNEKLENLIKFVLSIANDGSDR
jgi:xylan 1,4-beta-xylosidase